MSDMDTINRLIALEVRSEQAATKEWVRSFVEPIKEAVIKTEIATTSMSEVIKGVCASHDKLLAERSARETEEHDAKMAAAQEQTWQNVLTKKVAPVIGAVMGVITLIGAVGGFFTWWILNYVLPHAKP